MSFLPQFIHLVNITILPEQSFQESLETSKVYGVILSLGNAT